MVGGICALGICVRLLYLAAWAGNPLFHTPVGDELNFHQTALGFLGVGPQVDSFLYQPFYSFYLALVYKVLGVDPGAVRTVQLLIGLVNICLFYGLGRALADRSVGKLSALLAALYGPFVFFEGLLLAPALAVPLLCGGLWLLLMAARRKSFYLMLPAGLLVGLALMARPNLLLILPPAGVWWLVRVPTWRLRLLGAGAALAGLALGLAPSWVHNIRQGLGFVPVSASGGHSFFIGNNPQASGRFHVPRDQKIDDSSHQAYRASLTAVAERSLGRSLSLAEVSSYWYGRGFDYWAQEPGEALVLFGHKLILAVNSEEMPIHHPYFVMSGFAPVLSYLLTFGVIFAFVPLGLILGWRTSRGTGLLLWCAVSYLFGLAVFYVADRYRLMLLPMLIPLAALGMVSLTRRVARTGIRSSLCLVLVLGASFAITQPRLIGDGARARAYYGFYNLMGKVEGDQGRFQAAERYWLQALGFVGPGQGGLVRGNLGLLAEKRGDLNRALDFYGQAARFSKSNRFVRIKLAQLAERAGDLAQAVGWWREVRRLAADPAQADMNIERLESRMQAPPDAP